MSKPKLQIKFKCQINVQCQNVNGGPKPKLKSMINHKAQRTNQCQMPKCQTNAKRQNSNDKLRPNDKQTPKIQAQMANQGQRSKGKGQIKDKKQNQKRNKF